jgi:hypothetical protein
MTPVYICDRPPRGLCTQKASSGLSAIETWFELWNININEDKTQAFHLSNTLKPPEDYLTFNERNIPSVNHVKYLGVIFNNLITWRLHIEMIETKAFRTFIRVSSVLKVSA